MAQSIIQDEKECYITHSTSGLHKHHILGGAFRNRSERYGLWVWLRYDFHIQTPFAVHNSRTFDLQLKCVAQRKFESIYGHERWMNEFHRNYLEGAWE